MTSYAKLGLFLRTCCISLINLWNKPIWRRGKNSSWQLLNDFCFKLQPNYAPVNFSLNLKRLVLTVYEVPSSTGHVLASIASASSLSCNVFTPLSRKTLNPEINIFHKVTYMKNLTFLVCPQCLFLLFFYPCQHTLLTKKKQKTKKIKNLSSGEEFCI